MGKGGKGPGWRDGDVVVWGREVFWGGGEGVVEFLGDGGEGKRAFFDIRCGEDARPAIGEEDGIGGLDIFGAEEAFFDGERGGDPVADDAVAGPAGEVWGGDAVTVDEEDIGGASGDEFLAVVKKQGLIEAGVAGGGEGVEVWPIVGGLEAPEDGLENFLAESERAGGVWGGWGTIFAEDEDPGMRSGIGGGAVACGDINAGEAGGGHHGEELGN